MASVPNPSNIEAWSIHGLRSQIYSELDYGRHIRLIKLLPGQWFDEIRCELSSTDLDQKPIYKALSYAWGLPRFVCPILLNGFRFLVTVNLDSALRRLRQRDGPVTLWVDALCINQSNDRERTHQVNLMQNIFSNTEEVIVYLGEEASNDIGGPLECPTLSFPAAIFNNDYRDKDKLETFRTSCKSKKAHRISKSKVKASYAMDVFCFIRFLADSSDFERIPPFDDNSQQHLSAEYQRNLFESLRLLMRSRWWNRIWIIQEIVVPKVVTIVYGSMVAPWRMFVSAALCYSRNEYSPILSSYPREYTIVLASFSQMVRDIHYMRELWTKGKQTALLQLLRQFSGRGATDDRDKVYALLGLARDRPFLGPGEPPKMLRHWAEDRLALEPDYSLDIPTVFLNTALHIIERTKSLGVLVGDLGRKNRHDLPSWVPDWSATYDDLDRRRAENTENYNAAYDIQINLLRVKNTQKIKRLEDVRTEYIQRNNAERLQADDHSSIVYYVILWASAWSRSNDDGITPEESIKEYYERNKIALRYQRPKTLEVSGLWIDDITVIGDACFSNGELTSIVQSWGILAAENSLHCNAWYRKDGLSLGENFRRTLCGDIIQTGSNAEDLHYRRISSADKDVIMSWLLKGANAPFGKTYNTEGSQLSNARKILFPDLGGDDFDLLTEQTGGIDAAIKLATNRRRFFITKNGYIGLGPLSMCVGDQLWILLGGRTPFLLRNAGRDYNTPRYEVIGDCYAHGIMDGEAIEKLASPAEYRPEVLHLRQQLKEADKHLQTKLTEWHMHEQLMVGQDTSKLRKAEEEIIELGYRLTQTSGYENVTTVNLI